MIKARPLFAMATILFSLTSNVMAEGAAAGSDMWTRIFEQWGLFHPHANFCDSSTEVFVSISGSASQGFCLEKNERTAATWDTARDTCASNKKRLPEPGEFKFACVNTAGLSNMTNDFEWVSNFAITLGDYSGAAGVVVPKMGSGYCKRASYDYVAYSATGGLESSLTYRCVR